MFPATTPLLSGEDGAESTFRLPKASIAFEWTVYLTDIEEPDLTAAQILVIVRVR